MDKWGKKKKKREKSPPATTNNMWVLTRPFTTNTEAGSCKSYENNFFLFCGKVETNACAVLYICCTQTRWSSPSRSSRLFIKRGRWRHSWSFHERPIRSAECRFLWSFWSTWESSMEKSYVCFAESAKQKAGVYRCRFNKDMEFFMGDILCLVLIVKLECTVFFK